MNLEHVLRDIRDGWITADTLDRVGYLPIGLTEYYRTHWRAMRKADLSQFRNESEPVIFILATASEPVSTPQIVEWTSSYWPDVQLGTVRHMVKLCREFLHKGISEDGNVLSRLYHLSFRDFLQAKVGMSGYHSGVAMSALRKIGTEAEKI